jgi:hypothetical protein
MIFFVHSPELLRILMTASSATARLLSFVVLLLSIAPLGSFYVLFCSLTGKLLVVDHHAASDATATLDKAELSLSQILNDPNASLTELWTAIFVNHWTSQHKNEQKAAAANYNLASFFPIPQTAAHQLDIVLPWLLCMGLGFFLSIASFIWGQQQLQIQQRLLHDDSNHRRGRALERRRERILRKLSGYSKRLEADDCIGGVQEDEVDDCSDESFRRHWKLPRAGLSLTCDEEISVDGSDPDDFDTTKTTHGSQAKQPFFVVRLSEYVYRTVRESCVICMVPYALQDEVAWSPNSQCVHCFHKACVVSWLELKSSKQQLCPCCRQAFVRPMTTHPNGW